MPDIAQFERIIIKGLLCGYDSRRLMTRLNIEYFETIPLRVIFQAIADYYHSYSEVPRVDILINELRKSTEIKTDDFKNMESFLLKEDKVTDDEFKYAINEVEREYLSRKIRVSMKQAVGFLDKGDPKKAQDILLRETMRLSSFGRAIKILDFVGDFDSRKNDLIYRKDNPEKIKEFCIPTGVEKLDYELDGGLRKGELGLILGQPEGGKSISLQDFSVSAALNGFSVALVTIEMTPEQTSYRLDSRLSQIKYRKFRRAQLDESEISKWESDVKRLKENSLKIIGVPEGCSCRLIESELSRMSAVFQPDLVVVDYAGIMSPNEGSYVSSMDWKYVGEIVRNLKGLALKLNIPIWSACQILVGAKEKAEVSFVDVGLARQQIAAHADICVAIIQTSQMAAMDLTKLQLVKVREGCESRSIEFANDFDRIKLVREISKQDDISEEAPF